MTVAVTSITVRSTDLDAYGHVNNARYVEFFEWGRFDWTDAIGLASVPQEEECGYVVVDLHVAYKKEARLGEQLTLRTWLIKVGRSSVVVAQQLKNADDVVVAEGEVTLVAFDPVRRRARSLPRGQEELLRRHWIDPAANTVEQA